MTTTCPKCRFVRPADTTAPDWQCPACGVAYAKARAALDDPAPLAARPRPDSNAQGLPWAAIAFGALFLFVVWAGFRMMSPKPPAGAASVVADARPAASGGGGSMAELASAVRDGDVVIYSAAWCGTCTQAKQWMRSNGFKYDECDVEKQASCAEQFRDLGGRAIPIVVVRGHRMREGFNSDEFISAVKQSAG